MLVRGVEGHASTISTGRETHILPRCPVQVVLLITLLLSKCWLEKACAMVIRGTRKDLVGRGSDTVNKTVCD